MLDAAAAMEFVPEGAIEVLTGDYRLLRHPDWVLGPSLGARAGDLVAFADDEPVSSGGWTLTGGRSPWENRTAVRRDGATLAMAKGRALASGPILLRGGLTDYGEEQCFWLPVT
jgi:hypothetical protein